MTLLHRFFLNTYLKKERAESDGVRSATATELFVSQRRRVPNFPQVPVEASGSLLLSIVGLCAVTPKPNRFYTRRQVS